MIEHPLTPTQPGTAIDDGGPAYPEIFTDLTKGPNGNWPETYSAGGMTLRDAFAMAAPEAPLWEFEPWMREAKPREMPPFSNDGDGLPSNFSAICAWENERKIQIIKQWPYVWADSQIASRKVVRP